MPKYSYADIKSEYKMMHDKGDPWGSVMQAWFSCAAELWQRGLVVPVAWGYSPGLAAVPTDPEDFMYDLFRGADNQSIVKFGNVLAKYAGLLKRAGKDY